MIYYRLFSKIYETGAKRMCSDCQDFIERGCRILDLGCADGTFLPTLNYYAKNIVATDINQELIFRSKYIKENVLFNSKKINLLTSDGLYLPFRDSSFNTIFCLEVLEHVKNPRLVIKEIFRILKKEGTFVSTIPVEIGPSLLIREIISRVTNFHRPKYTIRELINSALLKKPGPRNFDNPHKNFDWRIIYNEVKSLFKTIDLEFIPIKILKDLNPIVLIKTIKR
jgi:2-polyprenyl-3-methyl-5-hydroxy-6-metoxy-1,4-benzoquinol methylase